MNYNQLVAEITSYTQNTFSTADMNTFIEQAEQRIFNNIQFPDIRKTLVLALTANSQYLASPADFLSSYSIAAIDLSGNYHFLLNKDVNFIREAFPNSSSGQAIPQYYGLSGPQNDPTNITFIFGPTPDQAYNVELQYYYYPPSIVWGQITLAGPSFTSGSGYINGTFYNAALTGGTGTGATAIISIVSGSVSSVTVESPGSGYVIGDTLSYSDGSGSGFSVQVSSVNNATGTTWLGNNFDTVLFYGALVEAYTFMKGEQDVIALYDKKYTDALAEAKRLGDGMDRQDAYRSGQYRQTVT